MSQSHASPRSGSTPRVRRPPRIELSHRRIRVVFGGIVIADTTRPLHVIETLCPRTWYIPPEDVRLDLLIPSAGTIWCEFKGRARLFDLIVGSHRSTAAAWSYPNPRNAYVELRDHVAFRASRVDEAWVDDRRAHDEVGDYPQSGWITREVVSIVPHEHELVDREAENERELEQDM
ncbi:MAG: DUF427 domain-containing protein [Deltaproteobacteria bacterium]|nr:DUF427 domain-containing protein [Deltaproteobacteria bacterium]